MRLALLALFAIACSSAAPAPARTPATTPPAPPPPSAPASPAQCGASFGDCPPDEICVLHYGPVAQPDTGVCQAVPATCRSDRSCECLGPAICRSGNGAAIVCTSASEHAITCSCMNCP